MPFTELLEKNANRLIVAATYAPAYIWNTVSPSGFNTGYLRMSGSGTASWSSEYTEAMSVMSWPFEPTILIEATASGAASWFFADTTLIGRMGGVSPQSSLSIMALIFLTTAGASASLDLGSLACCSSTYGMKTL